MGRGREGRGIGATHPFSLYSLAMSWWREKLDKAKLRAQPSRAGGAQSEVPPRPPTVAPRIPHSSLRTRHYSQPPATPTFASATLTAQQSFVCSLCDGVEFKDLAQLQARTGARRPPHPPAPLTPAAGCRHTMAKSTATTLQSRRPRPSLTPRWVPDAADTAPPLTDDVNAPQFVAEELQGECGPAGCGAGAGC